MIKETLVTAILVGGGATAVSLNTTNTATQSNELRVDHSEAQNIEAQPTLWGIYGKHSVHDCPVNNRKHAEYVVAASTTDLKPLLDKYGVVEIKDRYHSGLEHTFMWAVETTRPHDLQGFAIELGIASWNDLTFVPLITFEDGVVPMVAQIHNIDQ